MYIFSSVRVNYRSCINHIHRKKKEEDEAVHGMLFDVRLTAQPYVACS